MLKDLLLEAVNVRVTYRNVKLLYGKYVEVESSNIHSLLYLPTEKLLRIRFKGDNKTKGERATFGSEYQYFRIPIRVFITLLNAPSHGSQFWQTLRNTDIKFKYKYTRLADWSDEEEEDEDLFDEEDEDLI
jgi:hypothetical protein